MNLSPRQRLLDLAGERGVSLSALSRMLGRNVAYLGQFVNRGTPERLDERDRQKLADFFGVPERELMDPGDIFAPMNDRELVDGLAEALFKSLDGEGRFLWMDASALLQEGLRDQAAAAIAHLRPLVRSGRFR